VAGMSHFHLKKFLIISHSSFEWQPGKLCEMIGTQWGAEALLAQRTEHWP